MSLGHSPIGLEPLGSSGLIYNCTIGATGDYTSIAQWSAAVKAESSLKENVVTTLIDDANYAWGASSDLDFSSVTLNGFTITLTVDPSVRHNGTFGNGARVATASSGNSAIYLISKARVEYLSLEHTDATSTYWAAGAFFCNDGVELYGCIGKVNSTSTHPNVTTIRGAWGVELENVLIVGGTQGYYTNQGSVAGTLRNVTVVNAINAYNVEGNGGPTTVENCVAYNCTNDWVGVFDDIITGRNNAGQTALASVPTELQTNYVELTADPFVDLASENYRPVRNGQLDNSGTTTYLTTDIVGEALDERHPIGAFEDDSGIKDIGTSGSFSEIANWSAYVKALSSLTRNEEGRLIDDANYAWGTRDDLNFGTVTLNGFTITLTVDPSVKHNGWFGSGARVEATNIGNSIYDIENCILEDFYVTNLDTTSGNSHTVRLIENVILNRLLLENKSLLSNSAPVAVDSQTNATINSCILLGGEKSGYLGRFTNYYNCLMLNPVEHNLVASSFHLGNVSNCIFYGAGLGACQPDDGNRYSGTYSNNATDDSKIIDITVSPTGNLSTNDVTGVTSVAFVDSANDDYTPSPNGVLTGSGVATANTTDLVVNTFSTLPSIGAIENIGGSLTIGASGDFQTLTEWVNFVVNLGTLQASQAGTLIDNAVYLSAELNFQSVTQNGFGKPHLIAEESVRHNGTVGSGARIHYTGTGYTISTNQCNVSYVEGRNLLDNATASNTMRLGGFNDTAHGCLLSSVGGAAGNGMVYVPTGAILDSCIVVGNGIGRGVYKAGSGTIRNCTVYNFATGFESGTTSTYTIQNNVAYNCTTGWAGTWNGTVSHNASEDGTHPGTNGVTLSGDPFVDSANFDFRPVRNGELDNVGTDTGLLVDAFEEPFDERYPIGALEDDSGIKDIGTTGSFSEIANWSTYIKELSSLTRNEEGRLIDDAIYTYGSQTDLDFSAVVLNNKTITLRGFGSGVRTDLSNGARLEGSVNDQPLYNPVSNVTIEDFKGKHTRTIGFNQQIFNLSTGAILRRVIAESANTSALSSSCIDVNNQAIVDDCLTIGNNHGINFSDNGGKVFNTSVVSALSEGFTTGSDYPTITIKNSVAYDCGVQSFRDGYFTNGTFSNNASSDGLHPGINGVTLTEDPFIDSANGDYRIKPFGQLANAGTWEAFGDEAYDFEDGTSQGWTVVETTPANATIDISNTETIGKSSHSIYINRLQTSNDTAFLQKSLNSTYSDIYVSFKFKISDPFDYTFTGSGFNTRILGVAESSQFNNRGFITLRQNAPDNITIEDFFGSNQIQIQLDTEYKLQVRRIQDATNGGMQVWLNDVLVIDDLNYNTSISGVGYVIIGSWNSSDQIAGNKMWFDEIIISDNYINTTDILGNEYG